ncbi:MAG: NUDIX domain-containing protein [Symploca sp. SIO3C6]|nr:NUDIX domain-containing protein [Symploca sp. SIO3C6]
MGDYIKWIRSKVGNEAIFLNYSAACILNNEGKIILQKRGDFKGSWGFPGGALELGESAEEALLREVKEETGLRVKIENLIGVYTKYFLEYPNGDKTQIITFFFLCTILNGELYIDNQETLDLVFVEPTKAPKLFNQQHQDALNDFINQQFNVIR